MDYNTIMPKFKQIVAECINGYSDKTDGKTITSDDVYVVWYCKTLKNAKALLSTPAHDGMYYEITYDGAENVFYFDAYKKSENRSIK